MELKSPGFTKLTISENLHSYRSGDMLDNVTRLIDSLLTLRDCLDNSITIAITIDVSFGPDSEYIENNPLDEYDEGYLEEDDEEDEEDSYVPQVGDRVVVTSETAAFGNLDLFGMNGTITRAPNRDTDAYMIKFPSLTESILMFKNEFNVTIPFPPVEVK